MTTWGIGEAERLKLLDAKIDYYAGCLAGTPEANALQSAL